MPLFSIIKKLFRRKNHPAHLPHVKSPPPPTPTQQSAIPQANGTYNEVEADMHTIAGTGISFGSKKMVGVDPDGNAQDVCQKQSYLIGTGRLISEANQVAGMCPFCHAIAEQQYQAGTITLEEAQLQSLFDKNSEARCDICGRTTCSMHTRPIQINDQVISVCVQCQKTLKPKYRLLKTAASLLISPFLETK